MKCGVLNYVLNSEVDYDYDMICILDIVATDELVMKFLKKEYEYFQNSVTQSGYSKKRMYDL